ncbi:hypothetical protein GcM3_180015 [Golovinomyces cichoracearum]|uniref:Uncharacterized protein n=1 Tax=Golovinomyces cichoracearum TaxID=62708 RepID=A0A420HMK7_9PEZI|nr:hypothetical protein GcM3_180015 [Golovinomyces cichoracearum]
MFEEIFDLEDIRLTSSTGSLEVSATSRAFFKPSSVSNLSRQSNPAIFKPDHVWVTRGSRCALDLRVFLNNQKLQSQLSFPFIEKLGYSALVAELWSRLSLRTFLYIPQESRSIADNPDFSISIIPVRNDASVDSCMHETINITPLNMVPNVSLERIEIRFHINVKRPNKKVKLSQTGPNHDGGMLQEILPVSLDKEQASYLPSATRESIRSSSFVTKHCPESACWNLKQNPSNQVNPEHIASSLNDEEWSTVANKPSLPLIIINQKISDEDWQYPIQKIQEFDGRFIFPKRLSFIPSLSPQVHFLQTNDELTYQMQNEVKPELSADEQEMLFARSFPAHNADKIRSSKLSQNLPLDPTDTSSSKLEQKYEDFFNLSSRGIQIQNEASEMLQIVLNLLVTGKIDRESRKHSSYKLETPYPKKSLAKLVPSLFTVGFSWSVEINFQYLSSIVNTMSNSLTRNCLSPSLQKKLSHIARLTYRDDQATSATERLYNAIYICLWGMMQNKLNEQPNRKSHSRSPLKYSEEDHMQSSRAPLSSNQKDFNFLYQKDYNDEENAEYGFHENFLNDLDDPDLLNEELEGKESKYKSGHGFIGREDKQICYSKDMDLLFDTVVDEDTMLI